MREKALAPAIRFIGFTDAWEQRKVKNVAPLQRGFDLPATQMKDGDYPVVMSNGVGGYHSKFKVKGPGVITGRSGTIGRLHYIEGDYWPHNTSLWVTDFKGNYPKFIYHLYQKLDLSRFGSGSGVPTLNRNDVHDALVEIPQTHEQQRIAEWFDCLDHLITLQQHKYSQLCNIKKSMLERMFPKEGASVPEIRFDGFTDTWEQRKLGEIADKVIEKNTGLQYMETFTNSAEFGIISQRDFFDHDISKIGSLDGYYIVQTEDFVYNPRISTSAPVGPISRNKLGRTGVMSPLYTVFRSHSIDTTYLEHFFKCDCWHSFMNFNGDSGARSDRFSIKDDVFFQMPIWVPHIDEQRKIGKYLDTLDHLITLHQRKLERLQNIKTACLEKMFV